MIASIIDKIGDTPAINKITGNPLIFLINPIPILLANFLD
jgi:hypothetical protein